MPKLALSRMATFLVALTSFGCGSSSSGSGGAGTGGSAGKGGSDGGAPAATWTQVYTTVIAKRCMPCHTTAGGIGVMQGHLDMTSKDTAYSNLVDVATAGTACTGKGKRVVPRMPDSSIMYLKVSLDDASPCGAKMPLGGPSLPQAEVDEIESWIKGGAMNN